jgi:hypothetical protein
MANLPLETEVWDDEFDLVERIRAFGELKSIEDWVKDPRCGVGIRVLRERVRRGMPAEKAMGMLAVPELTFIPTKAVAEIASEVITAFGETKTAKEWEVDPRCSVSAKKILDRIERGVYPEDAISFAVVVRRRRNKAASSSGPRNVGGGRKQRDTLARPYGRQLTAFGETKLLIEWLDDPRVSATPRMIQHRLKQGWNAEDALTAAAWKGDRALVCAFGQTRSITHWAQDDRCMATKNVLERRLRAGWDAESAITTPNSQPGKATKGKRVRTCRTQYITAFGETKTCGEWADDPRCAGSEDLIDRRIRRGWPAEQAISLPPQGHAFKLTGERPGTFKS